MKLYKIKGVLWDPILTINGYYLREPYCPVCRCRMDKCYGDLKCFNCKKEVNYDNDFEEFREQATKLHNASILAKYEIVSLDEPPTQVKARDDDEKYFVAVKIGQKDGKRVGVVYFGEKTKEQSKEDYSQLFIDLDDEQLRFDKSNKHPKEILAKLKAEFPDVDIEQKFKGKK